jgi:hypothetical protein
MVRIVQSRTLIVALALVAAMRFVSANGAASAQEASLIGCWRHESEQGRYKNFLEICLGEGGKAETTEFRNGAGRGRNARWTTADNRMLSLVYASDDKVSCTFDVVDGSKLGLSECSIVGASSYSNVFKRENPSGDGSARHSVCWGRQYPDNGDFKIAEITERTPAIVELEHKQVEEDEPSVAEGTIVVVWSRTGQYACVENLTDGPEEYLWVDQGTLKNNPLSSNGEDPWPGSYRRVESVEIISAGVGKYNVHGKIDHTMGHGPGWGLTTSNEIFAFEAKIEADAIQVTLRRDIATAGSKAPKGVENPGFIDDRCRPVLFVKGPVLLIKDRGDCGDGSVFQGYWRRQM